MDTETLDWLESRNGCSRYATDPEHSIWLCDECSEEADPYEGGCPCQDDEDEDEDNDGE